MDAKDDLFRVDKTAFSVVSSFDETTEKEYWRTKTPHERLQALELMRQVIYGYKPATVRFQRFFEVEFKTGKEY